MEAAASTALEDVITLVRLNAHVGSDRDLRLFDCHVTLSVSGNSCRVTFDFNESGVIGDDELVAYWTALRVLDALFVIETLEGLGKDEWFPLRA